MPESTCRICDARLPPRRRVNCSDECQAESGRRAAKAQHRAGRVRPPRRVQCVDCHEWREVKSKGAPSLRCRACYMPHAIATMRALVDKQGAEAEQRRQSRLPVLHPNPDEASQLPTDHPARREAWRRRVLRKPVKHPNTGWAFFISGPCAWCAESFMAPATDWAAGNLPKFCSKRCLRSAAKNRRGRFTIPNRARLAIYERDGWVCQLCDDPVDPSLGPSNPWAATLDHIECQSWSDEPDHSPENLRLAHRWCNSVRGDESRYDADFLKAS